VGKIYTVTKDNEVLVVSTNLSDLMVRLENAGMVAPHYNTLYKNFQKENKYIYDGVCYQKFVVERNVETNVSSAKKTTRKKS
jgi:hypothetical protein